MAVAERLTIAVKRLLVLASAAVVTLLALPAPIHSVAWEPPRRPTLDGPLAPNQALRGADKLAAGQLVGPCDVVVDAVGRVLTGTLDGKIVRIAPNAPLEVLTETGGRPLGLALSPAGELLVADGMKGLLRVDGAGNIEVLAREAEGQPLNLASDVAVAKDGTIYLTDASDRHGWDEQLYELLEARPSGRVIRFDPITRVTTVIARDLYLANGLALAPDETFLLVSESGGYRVTKVWLTGERRNLSDRFVDNLPGLPDDLSFSPRGTLWLALSSARSAALDAAHPLPFVKDSYAGLPALLRPRTRAYGLVLELDREGRTLRSFHDEGGERFRDVSAVIEDRGALLFGTTTGSAVGSLPL
ncbi:MAG: SMP-30/gluconolactonase/LRE family protein [Deltaproteobacteria bacterium]|nr:SMP-30/gluconolactonase/LRE family protein [Deltaproteobacteria bacterium]